MLKLEKLPAKPASQKDATISIDGLRTIRSQPGHCLSIDAVTQLSRLEIGLA